MEDIIEEIVGEINDEFDEALDIGYKRIDIDTVIFEGKTSLNDFCKVMDEDPAVFEGIKGESESLGGLLLEINKNLPGSGEKIQVGKFLFEVEAVDRKKIKRVKVFRSI
jgi:putative hemolysin